MASSSLACAACMRRLVLAPLAARAALPEATFIPSVRFLDARRNRSTQAIQTQHDFEKVWGEEEAEPAEEREAKQQARTQELAAQYALKKLKVIDDPFHVGQAVVASLKKDQFDNALVLTEKASRTMNVVVSWNAILAYQLGKGEIKTAFKTFNNMKKRGQLPNVQTYTTIFSGLLNATNKSVAVAEAVKHYNLLLQDARLEANIFHTNAVLKLCAQAHDLDQMLLIANTLDNKARTPDSTTYTVLLEGIRHKVWAELKGMDPRESERYRKDMGDKAMILWSEVVRKWKNGRLRVDERLVNAMARTYPFQQERSLRPEDSKIFDLLQEVMNIPNYAKDPDWDKKEAKRLEREPVEEDSKGRPKASLTKSGSGGTGMFAKPGPRTLGLILEVLGGARRSALAIKYWNKLVDDFGVQPDKDNYFRMLVLLKASKSSAHVAWLLTHSRAGVLNAGHFTTAMNVCINDNINPNAVDNALSILKRANEVLPPNQEELMMLHRLYLRTALVSHHRFRKQSMQGGEDAARASYARQIWKALEELWPSYHQLHKQWFEIAPKQAISDSAAKMMKERKQDRSGRDAPLTDGQVRNAQREVIALARNMYAACNKLMVEEMLSKEELEPARRRAAAMNREIQRFYSDRGQQEPNLAPPKMARQISRAQDAASKRASATGEGLDEPTAEDVADQRIADEAAEFAEETAPAISQDGIERVGAEFVWDTRKPMGSRKGGSRSKADEQEEEEPDMRRMNRRLMSVLDAEKGMAGRRGRRDNGPRRASRERTNAAW
ncbi:PPR repeat family protein [Sarocladium implicatum]|nr:PPR repeat family protein [Sarocladium implicatum]